MPFVLHEMGTAMGQRLGQVVTHSNPGVEVIFTMPKLNGLLDIRRIKTPGHSGEMEIPAKCPGTLSQGFGQIGKELLAKIRGPENGFIGC